MIKMGTSTLALMELPYTISQVLDGYADVMPPKLLGKMPHRREIYHKIELEP